MTTLPDNLKEAVEELVEEKVAKATADLREENKALREENEDLHARVDELEERVSDLEDKDLHHRVNALRRGLSEAHDCIAEVEDDVAGVKRAIEAGRVEATPDELADIDPRDLLPVEKLASLPDEVATQQLDNEQNRNLYRARYIWKNWDELCYTTGDASNRGSHIKSSDVKRTLNTWVKRKHVSRARPSSASLNDSPIGRTTLQRFAIRTESVGYGVPVIGRSNGEMHVTTPSHGSTR